MELVNAPQIGIVVPTLGTRSDFLNQALISIRAAGECHIVIVAPEPENIIKSYSEKLFDSVIADPKKGLSQAINVGMRSMPTSIKYVNWLGDDDLLTPDCLTVTSRILENSPKTVCVYGQCSYIGPDGKTLWVNKSGAYAKWLMRVGPQLIPQPGSLFTLKAFNEVGGLNTTYKWAFDLDLFLKFARVGEFRYIPQVLSSFRWHVGSLSVGGRLGSVTEASKIRRTYLPRSIQFISPLWEFVIRRIILVAGVVLSKKSGNNQEKK